MTVEVIALKKRSDKVSQLNRAGFFPLYCLLATMSRIESNQIKSNQIKPNQIETNLHCILRLASSV
jgi:hypothetical protein